MAGILISPRVEQKILGKNAAWKLKNGSPKFKDILRQRCRLRIKERRSLIVAQARGLEDLQCIEQSLHSIFQEEYNRFVKEIESDFVEHHWDDDEMGFSGNHSEEDEQLLDHFDNLFDDDALEKLFNEVDQVVCPLCLKGSLREMPENRLKCDFCLTDVSGCSKLADFRQHISRCLETHSSCGCGSNVQFLLNPVDDTPCLYSLCSDCLYFDIVG